MQVFKVFFLLVKRNIATVAVYAGIFIILLLLLTNNREQMTGSFKESAASIGVVDLDKSQMSQGLLTYLESKHKVQIIDKNTERMAEELYYYLYEVIIEIPENMEADLLAGKEVKIIQYDSPDSAVQAFVSRQASQYLTAYKAYGLAGYTGDELLTKTEQNVEGETQVTIYGEGSAPDSGWSMYYQFLSYILLSVLIASIVPALISFHQKEIQERNLCSALSKIKQNLGLYAGTACYAMGLLVIFIAISLVLFGKNFGVNSWLCLVNAGIFLLIVIGIVFLISSFQLSRNAINMISNVVGLGMSFLGGVFVSMDLLSDTVITVAKWLPTYWYINGLGRITASVEALSLKDVATPFGMQLLMAVTYFALALVIRQMRHRN